MTERDVSLKPKPEKTSCSLVVKDEKEPWELGSGQAVGHVLGEGGSVA